MPCYSCSAEFGFLRKEVGCEKCGFSFCSRCCKKREVTSKQGDHIKQLVCNKCFNSLTSADAKPTKASPPLAHKKRMAALRSSYSVDSGSCDKDREIAERLQRLKKDKIKVDLPSEDEIAERLAILKGIEPSKYKAPPIEVFRPPDMRTTVEQAADLMKQVTLEAELDSRLVKPEDEIAARLARLRDEVPKETNISEKTFPPSFKMENTSEEMDIDQANLHWQKENASLSEGASKDIQSLIDDPEYKTLMMIRQKQKDNAAEECEVDEEDEEEEADRLVEKLLAADIDAEELDTLEDTEESNSKSDKETTEEFPWCVICTEDAKIRCFDCDSDIYCLRCFKECHDTFEITDHRTCPYLPDKNTAELSPRRLSKA